MLCVPGFGDQRTMYSVAPQTLFTLGFDTGALSDLGLLIRLDCLSVSPKDPHICASSVLGLIKNPCHDTPLFTQVLGTGCRSKLARQALHTLNCSIYYIPQALENIGQF